MSDPEAIGSTLSQQLARVKRLLETTTDPNIIKALRQEQDFLIAQIAGGLRRK